MIKIEATLIYGSGDKTEFPEQCLIKISILK